MKKESKMWIGMEFIVLLIVLKLLFQVAMNYVLIQKYEKGIYLENQAKMLTFLNFSQSYMANYNYGNILYQKEDYEKAIESYEKALTGKIPVNRECSIRINYALAICKMVEVDESNQESIKEAIKMYELAIEVLVQNGCANQDNDNGHSEKAQQLKNDIEQEIERLKKLQEKEEEPENKTEEKQEKDNTETIEKEIQEIKEEATKEQRKVEELYKEYKGDVIFDGKNW